jgi:hypothetical protein
MSIHWGLAAVSADEHGLITARPLLVCVALALTTVQLLHQVSLLHGSGQSHEHPIIEP